MCRIPIRLVSKFIENIFSQNSSGSSSNTACCFHEAPIRNTEDIYNARTLLSVYGDVKAEDLYKFYSLIEENWRNFGEWVRRGGDPKHGGLLTTAVSMINFWFLRCD